MFFRHWYAPVWQQYLRCQDQWNALDTAALRGTPEHVDWVLHHLMHYPLEPQDWVTAIRNDRWGVVDVLLRKKVLPRKEDVRLVLDTVVQERNLKSLQRLHDERSRHWDVLQTTFFGLVQKGRPLIALAALTGERWVEAVTWFCATYDLNSSLIGERDRIVAHVSAFPPLALHLVPAAAWLDVNLELLQSMTKNMEVMSYLASHVTMSPAMVSFMFQQQCGAHIMPRVGAHMVTHDVMDSVFVHGTLEQYLQVSELFAPRIHTLLSFVRRQACRRGQYELLRHYCDAKQDFDRDDVEAAVLSGSRQLLVWVHEHSSVQVDGALLLYVVRRGTERMVKAMMRRAYDNILTSDIMYALIERHFNQLLRSMHHQSLSVVNGNNVLCCIRAANAELFPFMLENLDVSTIPHEMLTKMKQHINVFVPHAEPHRIMTAALETWLRERDVPEEKT